MPEISKYELADFVRANPTPELVRFYDPTKDKCPHCGEYRKSGWDKGSAQWRWVNVRDDSSIKIKFRTREGKRVALLGKDICTDKCLDEELSNMIERDDPVALSIVKQFALVNKFPNGTAFKFGDDDDRNRGLMFWDDNKKTVVPADSILNGGEGAVPINFLVGDGDFNPNTWKNDFLEGVVASYPNANLIVEMRNYATAHPEHEKMKLKINGKLFSLTYNPKEMDGNWTAATIMSGLGTLEVSRGPDRVIDEASIAEAEKHVAAKAKMNVNATSASINRRTVKAPNAKTNANTGLNRLAALPGLKAQHLPNSNAFKALNAEEKNLIMKHLGGRTRKTRKRQH